MNDGQRLTWTAFAILVMCLRENNFEVIVGGDNGDKLARLDHWPQTEIVDNEIKSLESVETCKFIIFPGSTCKLKMYLGSTSKFIMYPDSTCKFIMYPCST